MLLVMGGGTGGRGPPRFEGGLECPSAPPPRFWEGCPPRPPPQCLTFIGINTFYQFRPPPLPGENFLPPPLLVPISSRQHPVSHTILDQSATSRRFCPFRLISLCPTCSDPWATTRAIIGVNSIVSGRNYHILTSIIAQRLTSRPFCGLIHSPACL